MPVYHVKCYETVHFTEDDELHDIWNIKRESNEQTCRHQLSRTFNETNNIVRY